MPTTTGHQVTFATRAARRAHRQRLRAQRRRKAATFAAAVMLCGGAITVGAHSLPQEASAHAIAAAPLSGAEAHQTQSIAATHDTTAPAQGGAAPAVRDLPSGDSAQATLGLATTTAAAPTAANSVALTPAAKARLDVEYRASRAADRAQLGARPGFSRPVEGTHMTSPFGPRWGRMHNGIDFAGPIGLPIRAVASGVVTVAGPASGYGTLIEITHDDGEISRYGHLSKIRVKVGDKVDPAHVIGDLGNEGRSTGPHLHFEIRTPKSEPFDPEPWLTERGIMPADVAPDTATVASTRK